MADFYWLATFLFIKTTSASQVVIVVKNPPANAGDIRDAGLIPGSGRSPGGGHGQPTPVFLPGESHGQRSLAATVRKVAEQDTREATEHTCMYANQAVASNSSEVLKGISKKEQTFLGGIHISNYK